MRTKRLATAASASLLALALALWWAFPVRAPVPFTPTTFPDASPLPSAPEIRLDRIVLLTLDTTRADHLSAYGYPRDTSPFFDQLASRGVVFTRAFTAMPTTVPAHATLFTGLHPIQHNVRKNGMVLGPDPVTLAEVMRGAGFATAGFNSTTSHFQQAALDRGFDHFDQPTESSDPWSWVRDARAFGFEEGRYRRCQDTVERMGAWLDRFDDTGRFFLWGHFFDPHTPFNRENRWTPEPGDAAERHLAFLRSERGLFSSWGTPSETPGLIDRYDGEIRALDGCLQKLVEKLFDRGFDENLLIVVTADHGEALGEHGHVGHGEHLYNEMLRVPFVLFFASGAHAGRRVHDLVHHVDLLPTLADWIDVPIAQALPMRGRSLAPLLDGAPAARERRVAFSSRREYRLPGEPGRSRRVGKGASGRNYAALDGRYKYILKTHGDDELYDLAADFNELDNLIGRGLPEETILREEILETLASLEVSKDGALEVDADTLKGLEALGYVP